MKRLRSLGLWLAACAFWCFACDSGSDDEGNGASGKKEGQSCKWGSSSDSCVDSQLMYCAADNTIHVKDCGKDACRIVKDGVASGVDAGVCASKDMECSEDDAGKTKQFCENGDTYSYLYEGKCLKSDDSNQYYWIRTQNETGRCKRLCSNENTQQCDEKGILKDYSTKDAKCKVDDEVDYISMSLNGDLASCSGNKISYCSFFEQKTLVSYECDEGTTCAQIKDNPIYGCFGKDDVCDDPDGFQIICIDDFRRGYVAYQKCGEATDGKRYWYTDTILGVCDGKCSKDGTAHCEKSIDVETGWFYLPGPVKCGTKFSNYCHNGWNIECHLKVEADNCRSHYKNELYQCVQIHNALSPGNDQVFCSAEECSDENATREVPDEFRQTGTVTEICIEAVDGKKYWLVAENILGLCSIYCDKHPDLDVCAGCSKSE